MSHGMNAAAILGAHEQRDKYFARFRLEAELSPSVAVVPADVMGGECSASRPAAPGTEPLDHGPENGRGQVADLGAECQRCVRVHQLRERAVSCSRCGALTFDFHAVCVRCQAVHLL